MKSSFSSSFNRVDTDLVIRNLIYSVLYVSMILACFSYLLWPLILNFKSQYIQERREKIIYTEIKKNYDAAVNRLEDFTLNNSASFLKLNNQQAFDQVQALVREHLEVKGIKRVAESKQENDQTRSITYAFSAQTKELEKLWQLMDKLTSLQASVVLKPPVKIQRASMQSSTYDIAFSLELRYNTYQAPAHLQEILAAGKSENANKKKRESGDKNAQKSTGNAQNLESSAESTNADKDAPTDSNKESSAPKSSAK